MMYFDVLFFFFNDPPPTEISPYSHTRSLHDALPISGRCRIRGAVARYREDWRYDRDRLRQWRLRQDGEGHEILCQGNGVARGAHRPGAGRRRIAAAQIGSAHV